MRPLALAALISMTALPAAAADLDGLRAMLARALEEQQVFNRCAVLTEATRGYVTKFWTAEVEATVPQLAQAGLPKAEIDAFAATAAPGHFDPPRDMSAGELMDYCAAAGDWETRMAQLNMVIPSLTTRRYLD